MPKGTADFLSVRFELVRFGSDRRRFRRTGADIDRRRTSKKTRVSAGLSNDLVVGLRGFEPSRGESRALA